MTAIPFTKMVGTGNDFIVVDTRRHHLAGLKTQWQAVSKLFCDRRVGVGADGVLVLEPSKIADVKMRIFNPDGSEAEMCGNGARCVALYVEQGARGRGQGAGAGEKSVTIETKAGVVSAKVSGNRVAMRMTDPTELATGLSLAVDRRLLSLGFVNTGVPHAVVPVTEVEAVDVNQMGRALRHHPHFAPRGTNVNFIQSHPKRPNRIRVRTYERGVEEETLACGTGVTASAVLHAVTQGLRGANGRAGAHRRRIEVEARSGDVLTVSFMLEPARNGFSVRDVVLEGVAERVFDGVAEWPPRSPS